MHNMKEGTSVRKSSKKKWKEILPLLLMLSIPLGFLILFHYVPMYGIQIAFRNYKPVRGITGSEWVGLKYFQKLFATPTFLKLVKNTLSLTIMSLLISFPAPIVLALLLNYMPFKRYAKAVQTVSYLPHFISTIVIIGIMKQMFNTSYGVVNNILELLGMAKIDFMGMPQYFRAMYIGSNIWQGIGWNAIIYISALAAVDPNLHESAVLDGASKIQRMWHIDLPTIKPTIVILLIMNFSGIMSASFEKTYAMQTDLNLSVSETLNTYVYKVGMQQANFSYAAAVGLFQSLVGFVLLMIVNQICRKLNETSLF